MEKRRTEHPGVILKEWMEVHGVDEKAVADAIGVSRARIVQILQGGRSVSTDTSLRLGRLFSVPGFYLASQQLRYDVEAQRDLIADQLKDIEPLWGTK